MKKSVPGFAERIKGLREKIPGQTQAEFAKNLGVTQPMISAWEAGEDEPSTQAYLNLGNMAAYPDNVWFWQQAGLDPQAMFSSAERVLRELRILVKPGDVMPLQRFRLTAQGREEIEPRLLIPTEHVPNPLSTICLVLDETNAGFAFSPGDIVVLDTMESGAKDLQPFWDQVILLEFLQPPEERRPGGWRDWRGKFLLGRLRCEESDSGRYVAVLGPVMKPETPYSGDRLIVIGRWTDEGPRSEKPRLRVDRLSWAAPKIRLFPGCRILGRVIAWFPAPPEKK
jgi:transcriptional regulator with XRE-family HTH domain